MKFFKLMIYLLAAELLGVVTNMASRKKVSPGKLGKPVPYLKRKNAAFKPGLPT
jgi:hypothetical protein